MMFGDMGHGSIIFAAGCALTLLPERFKDLGIIYQARYFFLLMGLMATYCGFIYNEFFALGTNMFGSCYNINMADGLNPGTSHLNHKDKIIGDVQQVEVYRRVNA